MSTNKLKGFRLSDQFVKLVEKSSKAYNLDQSRLIEALLFHFQNLAEAKQKEIIKEYLTKDL
jgi:hypothetical protein